MAAEARDGADCRVLELRDDVATLLGIELLRERRGADEVAEEYGQLAALAVAMRVGWLLPGGD